MVVFVFVGFVDFVLYSIVLDDSVLNCVVFVCYIMFRSEMFIVVFSIGMCCIW